MPLLCTHEQEKLCTMENSDGETKTMEIIFRAWHRVAVLFFVPLLYLLGSSPHCCPTNTHLNKNRKCEFFVFSLEYANYVLIPCTDITHIKNVCVRTFFVPVIHTHPNHHWNGLHCCRYETQTHTTITAINRKQMGESERLQSICISSS